MGISYPFLCLRRGVSVRILPFAPVDRFSLPTQRCFPDDVREVYDDALFSAYAEVFPSDAHTRQYSETFLCLRRGVSRYRRSSCGFQKLFSAYAEVFLKSPAP